MAFVRSTISETGLRRIAFSTVVVGFLVFFLVVMESWKLLAFVVAGWFDGALGLVDEFETAHRIHEFAFALILWPVVIGMLAQLRSPRKHVAAQVMALVPFAGLLLAMAVTGHWKPLPIVGIFGSLVLLAAILHPAGRDLVRSFGLARIDRMMLALVLVAAVPLLAFAATHVGLQTGAIEQAVHGHATDAAHGEVHQEHVDFGHFMLVAAFGFVVVGIGLLASLRPDGWRLSAWLTGILAAFFGLASVVFPETASSAGTMWGVAAIGWGIVFVAAAELTREAGTLSAYGERRATPTPEE